jgi:hypothetical protein
LEALAPRRLLKEKKPTKSTDIYNICGITYTYTEAIIFTMSLELAISAFTNFRSSELMEYLHDQKIICVVTLVVAKDQNNHVKEVAKTLSIMELKDGRSFGF